MDGSFKTCFESLALVACYDYYACGNLGGKRVLCTQFVPAKSAVGYNGWETKSKAGLRAICDLLMIGKAPGSPK